MIDVEGVQEVREVRLVAAAGEFLGYVGQVAAQLAERHVHALEVLVARARAAAPVLRAHPVVELEDDLEDLEEAGAHLLATDVEHASGIGRVPGVWKSLRERERERGGRGNRIVRFYGDGERDASRFIVVCCDCRCFPGCSRKLGDGAEFT